EGAGYTYTVGAGGAAIAVTIERHLTPILVGADADRIEKLWHAMWWALHYGGRGGYASLAISAVDIALWDLKARRQGTPLWRLLGGHDPRVPCYAGGIDLKLPLAALLSHAGDNRNGGIHAEQEEGGAHPPQRGRGARASHA